MPTAAREPGLNPEIDRVYLLLGQGDLARANDLSAALMAQIPDGDARRAAVLQARLDVLGQRSELTAPSGTDLHAAVERYAGRHAQGRRLAERLSIAEAVGRGEPATALRLAEQELAAAGGTGEDTAELQVQAARAAALINGDLVQARAAAVPALDAWRGRQGLRGVWHEVELYEIVGTVDSYTGSESRALAQFDRGLQLAVARFGADSAARIRIDVERARVLADLGRNDEALTVREGVLTAAQHRYGEHSMEAAKAESLIGAGLQEIGDYATARRRYAHAEAVLMSLPNRPGRERAIMANNYANLLQEMGEESAALDQYRLALAALGDDEKNTHVRAIVSANIGNTEYRLGRFDAAIADFRRALALREKSDGKDSPGLAYALEGLGSCAVTLKRYAEAEGYFLRAIAVRSRAVPSNHTLFSSLYFGLALAYWGEGRSDDAFRYARQTAENQQAMLATFASEFSERQSVAYRDLLVPATALAVTLAAQRGDAASIAAAWRLAMIERRLVARTQAQRLAAARSAHDPALAGAWEAWRKANSALGEAWLATDTSAERMAQLRAASEDAERALWKRAGHRPGAVADHAVEIADLARALPADGALIAFTEGLAADPARRLSAGAKQAPEDWYAFVLAANGQPTLHRVGNIDALTAELRSWYLELRDPASDPESLRRNGLKLRQALLDSTLGAGTARHLFIVPEGELFRISFAALPDDNRGYLIEHDLRVHYLAHESNLAAVSIAPAAAGVLLAGAPPFGSGSVSGASTQRQLCLRAAQQGFAAIPNAARELDTLQGLLSGLPAGPRIRMLVGAEATKKNVLAALPHANIVHLATHGFSLDESCADGPDARGMTLARPGEAAAPGAEQESLALSGLAFAGASVVRGHNPVGILSAGELAALDLSQVDWIVLSACDSGLGPIGRNEGVFGMRRALRLAGARTVVMSLWQVDDAATAGLMQALYRARFAGGAAVPDAMATAMRSVLSARRAAGLSDHPYYWAAFVSEGTWR